MPNLISNAPAVLADQPSSERLPLAALLAFAMTGFIAVLTETLPAGLLPEISAGLNVSEVLAGQLVSVYALGSLLASIPLTVLTSAWPRKRVLLLAVATFLVFNTITTLSTDYGLTLAARFMSGVAAGLTWGFLPGYARRLVPPYMQGRALAIAMVGIPVALSLGTPTGTWLGGLLGWRVAFGVMAACALVLLAWALVAVPDAPGQKAGKRTSMFTVLAIPGVGTVLAIVLFWMLAHNILYTFIGPFLVPSGLAQRVDVVLLVFGLASLAGIWLTGLLIDHHLRRLVLWNIAAMTLVGVALLFGMAHPAVIFIAMAVWGVTFGGASTQMQTAAADASGEHGDVVQAMVSTAWNLAIAGGGAIGGVLLDRVGVASFPWALTILMILTLAVAWWNKAAFPPKRNSASRKQS